MASAKLRHVADAAGGEKRKRNDSAAVRMHGFNLDDCQFLRNEQSRSVVVMSECRHWASRISPIPPDPWFGVGIPAYRSFETRGSGQRSLPLWRLRFFRVFCRPSHAVLISFGVFFHGDCSCPRRARPLVEIQSRARRADGPSIPNKKPRRSGASLREECPNRSTLLIAESGFRIGGRIVTAYPC
jgi:hypothetical protein